MHFEEALKTCGVAIGAKREPLDLALQEKLYSVAYSTYQAGEYAQGSEFFTQLILHNPYETRFWKGLAACLQMQKDYKGALHAWGVLSLLGNHPPEAHFHAAECYLLLGELDEVKKALECARLHLKAGSPFCEKIEYLTKQAQLCRTQ